MPNLLRRILSSTNRIAGTLLLALIINGIFFSSVLSQVNKKQPRIASSSGASETISREIQTISPPVLSEPLVSRTPMTGNYTVGVGQMFTKLVDAVMALKINGMSGPVRFLLTDAVYNEPPVVLTQISGSNGVNSITIQPSNGVMSSIVSFEVDNTENGCFVSDK